MRRSTPGARISVEDDDMKPEIAPIRASRCRVATLACAALCLVGACASAESYRGIVTTVVDGDTLIVEYVGQHISVRLWGIDAPKRSERLGTEAANSLAQFCLKKYATVNTTGEDAYGRMLGVVTCGSVNVNEAQARRGLARVTVNQGLDAQPLRTAERAARKRERGLWSPAADPMRAVKH
jgi:endonuclease YncB( thermonuclease family)